MVTDYFKIFFVISTILFSGLWGWTFEKIENEQKSQKNIIQLINNFTVESEKSRASALKRGCEFVGLVAEVIEKDDPKRLIKFIENKDKCSRELEESNEFLRVAKNIKKK